MSINVTRRSPLTGKVITKNLNITAEQLREYETGRRCIQNVFPNLPAADREFIMTGYTDEDWDEMFPEPHDRGGSYIQGFQEMKG